MKDRSTEIRENDPVHIIYPSILPHSSIEAKKPEYNNTDHSIKRSKLQKICQIKGYRWAELIIHIKARQKCKKVGCIHSYYVEKKNKPIFSLNFIHGFAPLEQCINWLIQQIDNSHIFFYQQVTYLNMIIR